MPNVGKSTLLNALRDVGIPGRMFRLTFFFFLIRRVFTATAYMCSNAQGPPHFRAPRADEGTFYTAETLGRPTCIFLRFSWRHVTFSWAWRQRRRARCQIGTDRYAFSPNNYMNGLTRLGSAGIKEGLYDNEALAAYLLYRLNLLSQSGMVIIYLIQ